MPQYFQQDSQDCPDAMVCDFKKQDHFYESIINGCASAEAMPWYNASEAMVLKGWSPVSRANGKDDVIN